MFTTLASTLRSAPGSVLDRMFDEESRYGDPVLDDDGNHFIDADPEAFPVILNFLRYGRCVEKGYLPALLSLKVEAAADYFGLTELVAAAKEGDAADTAEAALCSIADKVGEIATSSVLAASSLEALSGVGEAVENAATELEAIREAFEGCISDFEGNGVYAFRTTERAE